MKKSILFAFLILAAINVTGNYLQNDWLVNSSKPLLMPVLIIFFMINWPGKKDVTFYFTVIALFFSWVGDILLMLQNEQNDFFIFGLLAFLLAHITYIFNYYYLRIDMDKARNKLYISFRVLFLAFAGGALLNILWPELGELRLPVVLYTIVIVLMAVSAVLRRDKTSPQSYSYVYGGALLFIVSDGMIAISKFIESFEHARELIMLTYIFAQFFIVKGVLAHQKIQPGKK